jgi:uncharacterized membrane protein
MRKWYPWLLVGLAFGASAAMYSRLPDEMPTHWGVLGEVNGYSARVWGAWMLPIVLVALAVVMPRLPAIDPRRENYAKFRPSYDLVVNAVMTMVAVLHVGMIAAGAGYDVPMERLTPLMAGGLFVVLGNVLPRARPNWMFGIRTPWTLTNDRVWERTHRLSGILMVMAGLALMIMAVVAPSAGVPVVVGASILVAVVPIAYSYYAWRQETQGANGR